MAFNTENFHQSFKTQQTGALPTASPAYFEAYLTSLPPCLQGRGFEESLRGLRFRASAADLPGRQFLSETRETRGPHRMMPHSALYSTAALEFIETENFDIREFFDAWHEHMEGHDDGNMVDFYDNVIAPSLLVVAYNKRGNAVSQWEFHDIFPLSVLASQMNWTSVDGHVVVAIEFHYKKWNHIPTKAGQTSGGDGSNGLVNLASGFLQLSDRAQSAVKIFDTAKKLFKW